MTTPARARYSGYRFPAEIIGHAVWLYFRFPVGLRMLEELLAARGIIVSHETVRQWARKFGQQFGNHAQHGGTKAVFEMTYAGRLAMFAIRVSYPGGHSVWLTRRFPTVAWGLKKDALPFPTEADAARTIARLRPSGPVSIEPIAPEIAKPA